MNLRASDNEDESYNGDNENEAFSSPNMECSINNRQKLKSKNKRLKLKTYFQDYKNFFNTPIVLFVLNAVINILFIYL